MTSVARVASARDCTRATADVRALVLAFSTCSFNNVALGAERRQTAKRVVREHQSRRRARIQQPALAASPNPGGSSPEYHRPHK